MNEYQPIYAKGSVLYSKDGINFHEFNAQNSNKIPDIIIDNYDESTFWLCLNINILYLKNHFRKTLLLNPDSFFSFNNEPPAKRFLYPAGSMSLYVFCGPGYEHSLLRKVSLFRRYETQVPPLP